MRERYDEKSYLPVYVKLFFIPSGGIHIAINKEFSNSYSTSVNIPIA